MKVIGLTGGIGTGKSVVSGILSGLGAAVIDADAVGHEVYRKGTEGHRAVADRFGPGVVGADGEIDRAALGEVVFSDPAALNALNSLVHPRMREAVRRRLDEIAESGAAVAVIEAAVLMEAGWSDLADEVWVVDAPWEAVLRRLGPRFGGEEAIRARARAQMGREDRLAAADEVIVNDGSVDRLRGRVEQLYGKLTEAAREGACSR